MSALPSKSDAHDCQRRNEGADSIGYSSQPANPDPQGGSPALTEKDMAASEAPEKGSADDSLTSANQSEDAQYVTGMKLVAVSAGVTLASFLLFLDSTIVATSIPRITSQFESLSDVGWYGSAYLLAMCAAQLPFGKIYQLCSSKPSFLSALVIFEVGSLICGLAQSSKMLIVGRAVAGCGAGGISNGGLTIIGAAAPLTKRPILFGTLIGFSSIGLILGPLIGGALTQHASWRWCFYINLPIGAVTFLMLLLIQIPNAKVKTVENLSLLRRLTKVDLGGCVLFAGAVVMLLLALDEGDVHYRWNSATIIGLFCGSGVTFFTAFLAWEYYLDEGAMLPLGLLRNRVVSCAAAANIFANGAFFLVIYYLPLWFQVVKNASPAMSGVYTLPGVLSQILGTIATGFLVSKAGYYTPFIIVGSIFATVAIGLMSTFTLNSNPGMWIGYQILNGIGRGAILQQPITAVQSNLSKDQVPIGTALIAFCQNFGASIFVSLGQTAFQNTLRSALKQHAPAVNADQVISAGATGFRDLVSKDQVINVVAAYNEAITTAFYLAVGACAACFFLSFGIGWTNLKQKEKTASSEKQ